jgi:hypothetical protein
MRLKYRYIQQEVTDYNPLDLLLYREEEGSIFVRNADTFIPKYAGRVPEDSTFTVTNVKPHLASVTSFAF